MLSLIQLWRIILTSIGRITVVKCFLIIPNQNHLFISLPNQSKMPFYLLLGACLYLFGNQSGAKLKVVSFDFLKGGLKMVNITNTLWHLLNVHGFRN